MQSISSRFSIRWWWAAVAVVLIVISPGISSLVGQARAAGPVNLLTNPGFEAPFVKQCCQPSSSTLIDEVQVANGWSGWWRMPYYPDYPPSCGEDQSPKENCMAFHRPEWREAAPYQNRIRSGQNAQKYFTFFSNHEAGMYQVAGGVAPGQRLNFTVYMHAWSVHTDEIVSTGQASMNLKVGIDPFGGTDPFSPNIVWSAPSDAYDYYAPFSVEAVARNYKVTVFTYSRPVLPFKHNDVYLDDAALVVVGTGAVPPAYHPSVSGGTPTATRTRAPTATRTPTRTSRPTRTPTPTIATMDYVILHGDSLYKIAAKFGTTLEVLMRINNLTSTVIWEGNVLKVPIAPTITP